MSAEMNAVPNFARVTRKHRQNPRSDWTDIFLEPSTHSGVSARFQGLATAPPIGLPKLSVLRQVGLTDPMSVQAVVAIVGHGDALYASLRRRLDRLRHAHGGLARRSAL
jgi:hypothetical protein